MYSQERYLDKNFWSEIERGYEFDAAMLYSPSDTTRPLTFFIPTSEDGLIGRLEQKTGDFSPIKVDGKFRAVEQLVATPIKPRKVIIMSDNQINQSQDFDYIIVCPIFTIYDEDKSKPWYKLVKADKHPFFIYLPKTVRKQEKHDILERYVDISQMISIHKGILLKKQNQVPTDRMQLIEDNLIVMLSLVDEEENEQVIGSPIVNE